LCGIEKMHPFDSTKYFRVFNFLKEKNIIKKDMIGRVHAPEVPTREFLDEVVTRWFLFKMNYSAYISGWAEVPLFFLPAWLLRMRLLEPQARAS